MALKHAEPGEVVDLRPLGERLAESRTHAIVRTESFEAIRLVLPARTEIGSHRLSGRIMLHCIEGAVEIGFPQGARRLGAGDWIYLEGQADHSLHAVADASLLMTVLFDAEKAGDAATG